jgi:hypothetical protein
MSRSRHRLVVSELPYQVNKSNLVERIASLVREGRLEGITDLRDESDRRGMRLVIELSRTAEPQVVLAQPLPPDAARIDCQHHPAGPGRWRAAYSVDAEKALWSI